MQLLLCIEVALPLILLFLYLINRKTNAASKTGGVAPPGPRGLPLIGNLHQFAQANHHHIYLWKLAQKYGPILQIKLGSTPLVVISSSKLAKEVLKTQDSSFCSRPNLLSQRKLSYNALDMVFSPYGDYWRKMRKITTVHLFSARKTQFFRPIREDEVSRMVTKITSVPPSGGGGGGGRHVVNLSEMAMSLGTSLICRVAFGTRYADHGLEITKFETLSREARTLLTTFFVSDYFPLFGWIDRLTGVMDRLEKTYSDLDSFYEELIQEHLNPKREKKKNEADEDILDILIKLKENDSSDVDITWDHIKAILMNIFIAATETISVSVVWSMTALMKTPRVMKKAQAEIRGLVGEKGKLDEDDISKLPYLKAVVKEALRMYPPAPLLIPRETIETCTVEGYVIQPKTTVYINAWAIAKDPECWENPNEFMPERFINNDIDIFGHDFEVMPFGSGRRICPGINMGLANIELAVANLLYSFDWELPSGMGPEDISTDIILGITMHKKDPLILVAKNYRP